MVAIHPTSGQPLASLRRRLAGHMVDSFVVVVGGGLLAKGYSAAMGMPETDLIIAACFLAARAPSWVLLARQGQSIGKWVARTRVVDAGGKPAGPLRAVLLRESVLLFVGALKLAGGRAEDIARLVVLADITAIGGRENRCLHDRLAGTWVVEAVHGEPRHP